MKGSRKLLVILFTLFMVIGFTGCSKNSTLMKAFEKNSGMRSYAFKGSVEMKSNSFVFDIPNLESDTQQIQKIGLGSIKYTLQGKVQKEKNKHIKSQMNMGFDMGIIKMDMDMFTEEVMNKDKMYFTSYTQIPEILKIAATEKLGSVEYIYLDSSMVEEMSKDPQQSLFSSQKLTSNVRSITSMQKSFNEFVKNYTKETEEKIIIDKGQTEIEVNGKKEIVENYEINISKEDFNKFLEVYIKDEKKANELQTLLNGMALQEGAVENDISKMTNFIGKDGITMVYSIKDGYVVQNKIEMNLIINEKEFKYNILLEFFNINDDIKVEMPNRDEVKAIDFTEFTNILAEPND